MDAVLLPYLQATDDSARQEYLDELLLFHAAPVVRQNLRRSLGSYVSKTGKNPNSPARKFFRKLLKGLQYVPRLLITDKLKSNSAARAEVMPECHTPPAEVSEQQGREFASADQIAREGDETVQVIGPRAAFSLGLRNHYLTLPSGKTSVQS